MGKGIRIQLGGKTPRATSVPVGGRIPGKGRKRRRNQKTKP